MADLAALRTPAPDTGPGAGDRDGAEALLPAAGLPWFMTIFGRDTLVTCLQTMVLGQDLARAALRVLAGLQSTVDDSTGTPSRGRSCTSCGWARWPG